MAFVFRCDGCAIEGKNEHGLSAMEHWVQVTTIPFQGMHREYKKNELLFCAECWPRVAEAMRPHNKNPVRFFVGEVYEGKFDAGSRRAIVEQIWDDGRRGRLRFLESTESFESRWMELHQAGKWHRVIM